MTILEIYEKVSLRVPLEQRRFFNYFNDSVREIESLYSSFGDHVFEEGTEFKPAKSLEDEINILPLYHEAIVDNVIFLAGGDASYKAEFTRKAEAAWLKYWNKNAKHRINKRARL